MKLSVGERILAHIVENERGCWLWQGAVNEHGYGVFTLTPEGDWRDQYTTRSHRAAYEAFCGPIPDGLDLDHKCHNDDPNCPRGSQCVHRRCCNPAHLEPVTRSENLRRGWILRKGDSCKNGHVYDEANTELSPLPEGGLRRRCRACRAAAIESRRARAATDAPHGTRVGYSNWGCRCAWCKEAMRRKGSNRRRKVTGNNEGAALEVGVAAVTAGGVLWALNLPEKREAL